MSTISIDERMLADVPFGRNRLLAGLGSGLAAAAVKVFVPDAAQANHLPPVSPCFGFQNCDCCNDGVYPGTHCCLWNCTWDGNGHSHCPGGTQCWVGCYSGTQYRCCDWHIGTTESHAHCLCRGATGASC